MLCSHVAKLAHSRNSECNIERVHPYSDGATNLAKSSRFEAWVLVEVRRYLVLDARQIIGLSGTANAELRQQHQCKVGDAHDELPRSGDLCLYQADSHKQTRFPHAL